MRRGVPNTLPGALAILTLMLVVGWLYRELLPIRGPPASHLIWDSVEFSYPSLVLTSRFLDAQVAPLWNPFTFCGTPFFGNLQNLLFHPPSLLAAATTDLTLPRFQVLAVAQIAIGAVGTYLWGAARGRSRLAGLVGGIVFAGSGCVINFLSHYVLLALHCLLPYPFAFFEMWDRTRQHRYLVLASLALSSWLVTSYPSQVGYYLVAFVLYYLVVRLRRRTGPRTVAGELVTVALVPLCLAAVHLLPALLLTQHLTRASGVGVEQIQLQSLHPLQLYTTLMGGLSTLQSRFATPDVTMRDYSLGVFGWCAIAYGLRPARMPLLAALLVCVDLMLGQHSLLIGTLHRLSPLSAHSRHPTCEFGSLFAFIGITLLMDGVADLLCKPIERRRGLAALGVVAALVLSFQLFVDRFDSAADPGRMRWIAVGLPLAACAAFTCTLVRDRSQALRALALVALAAGPLAESTANRVWNTSITEATAPEGYFSRLEEEYYRAEASYLALDPLQPRRALYPIATNVGMLHGQRTDWGYDASILRVQEAALANPSARKVLLAPAPAFVADEARRSDDPEQVPLLQGARCVAAFPRGVVGVPDTPLARATVRVVEYRPNRTAYSIAAEGPAVVVFNELDVPGWSLAVDGRASAILTANGCFRAAVAPAGTHELVFSYRPPGLSAGIALSALGLALLVSTSAMRGRWLPAERAPES